MTLMTTVPLMTVPPLHWLMPALCRQLLSSKQPPRV
jgi:hypothetical protein